MVSGDIWIVPENLYRAVLRYLYFSFLVVVLGFKPSCCNIPLLKEFCNASLEAPEMFHEGKEGIYFLCPSACL